MHRVKCFNSKLQFVQQRHLVFFIYLNFLTILKVWVQVFDIAKTG